MDIQTFYNVNEKYTALVIENGQFLQTFIGDTEHDAVRAAEEWIEKETEQRQHLWIGTVGEHCRGRFAGGRVATQLNGCAIDLLSANLDDPETQFRIIEALKEAVREYSLS